MGNRRYSNKGYNARQNAANQAANDKSTFYAALIGAGLILIIIISLIVAIAVGNNAKDKEDTTTASTQSPAGELETVVDMQEIKDAIDSKEVSDFVETDSITNYIKLTVKDHGDIILAMSPEAAPITVENFKKLVNEGYYNGSTFHRIIDDFMIQGGKGSTQANTIKGEFSSNGVSNNISHITGVISMARVSGYNDSASSEFFIVDADSTYLDGDYAAFGYVIAGLDTVASISEVEMTAPNSSSPAEDVVIQKACFVEMK